MRHAWLAVAAVSIALAAGGGCTCGKASPGAGLEAGADASAPVDAALAADDGGAAPLFSLPIAALRTRDERVFTAGLVAADKRIDLAVLDGQGARLSQSTVIEGVGWTAGAELRFFAGPSGPALFFHGARDGKRADVVVRLDEGGRRVGEPVPVGASPCRVGDELVWLAGGKAKVLALSTGQVRSVALSSGEGEAQVACGADDARVLWEHEGDHDDEPVLRRTSDAGAARRPVFRDADFPDDEAREVAEYAWAGGLGFVRVGHEGSLALREAPGAGLGPVKKIALKVGDDDLVAVDSTLAAVYVVAAHEDEEAPCDAGSAAPAVRAVRIDRASFEAKIVPLAPAVCGRERGPFSTEAEAGKLFVWWVERAKGRGRTGAPIAGFGWAEIGDSGEPRTGFVDVDADGLASAGCAHGKCWVVALARPPGEDGMKPEPLRVRSFP